MTETYLNDVVRNAAGTECSRSVSYPIEASAIRKWAMAVYWPEPAPRVFMDAEYAPEDFDPFAWGPRRMNRCSKATTAAWSCDTASISVPSVFLNGSSVPLSTAA